MPDPTNFRVCVKCPHGKIFWVKLAIIKDPTVTAFGCGCPDVPEKPAETPAETFKREAEEKKVIRKFKRQLRKL